MILTAQEIVDGLIKSGGVLLWSIDLGVAQTTLSSAITTWRKAAPESERRDVALALAQIRLPHQAVYGVTGQSVRAARDAGRAPELSWAERRSDAAFLAQWGHL